MCYMFIIIMVNISICKSINNNYNPVYIICKASEPPRPV